MALSRSYMVVAAILVILVASGASLYYLLPRGATASSFQSSTTGLTSSRYTSTTASYSSQSPKASLWLTYHGDNARDGYYPSQSYFSSVHLGWTSAKLDGNIYAEPLLADGVLYAATENDSVYALSETSGAIIWRAHLGTPVPLSSLPCGDINPFGITGTPVIDPSSNSIYVATFSEPGNHTLFSLNLVNGAVQFQRDIDPLGANPMDTEQRGALIISNGMVYVPFGGLYGDCGTYHGWVVGLNENNTGSVLSYQVPSGREAGVWAPSGLSADSSGNIYATTGNGASSSNFDFGDSVIKLSPTLQELSYFAPSDWANLNAGDTDLGSTGPAILGANTIFQIGKDGVGYLVNATDLAGIGGELFSSQVCGASFGGTAYAAPMVYVPCTDGLYALRVNLNSGSPSFTKIWNGPQFFATSPIVSGGAVWTVDQGTGTLYAFSTANGTQVFTYNLGRVVHFETPTPGDGRIFVGAGNVIDSFVLTD